MQISIIRFPKWPCVVLALGVVLAVSSPSYGQRGGRIALRGTPSSVGGPPTSGFPSPAGFPLLNNGTLQISPNPNAGLPGATNFAYIASLPLGDRLPLNGIFADPQMTPQSQYGPQFAQNLLQLQQQRLFGNPLGPVGQLLNTALINQPFAPGVPGPPLGGAPPGFVGWGAGRPNYGYNPYMGQGMGYNPYMGQGMGYNPYMGQGYNPSLGQGMGYNPYMVGMMGMMGMSMMNAGYNLDPSQYNGANLFAQPGLLGPNTLPGNLPNGNVNLNGFGNGFGGF